MNAVLKALANHRIRAPEDQLSLLQAGQVGGGKDAQRERGGENNTHNHNQIPRFPAVFSLRRTRMRLPQVLGLLYTAVLSGTMIVDHQLD